MSDMCTQCGKNPVAVAKGHDRWCWQCAGIDPAIVPMEYGGKAPAVGNPEPVGNDGAALLHMDFAKALGMKEKPKGTAIADVEVIFTDPDGTKRLVRLVASEKHDIADRLVFNRKHGNRDFQYADVVVMPLQMALAMNNVIMNCAEGSASAQDDAIALLTPTETPQDESKPE